MRPKAEEQFAMAICISDKTVTRALLRWAIMQVGVDREASNSCLLLDVRVTAIGVSPQRFQEEARTPGRGPHISVPTSFSPKYLSLNRPEPSVAHTGTVPRGKQRHLGGTSPVKKRQLTGSSQCVDPLEMN